MVRLPAAAARVQRFPVSALSPPAIVPVGVARPLGLMPRGVIAFRGRMSRRFPLVLAAVAAIAGCGSSFDGSHYRAGELAFRVGPIPTSWKPVPATHAALAYRDEDVGATIAVNGRCGIDGEDVPLSALTTHLFLMFTDREIVEQQVL